jgi:hypothetical protein
MYDFNVAFPSTFQTKYLLNAYLALGNFFHRSSSLSVVVSSIWKVLIFDDIDSSRKIFIIKNLFLQQKSFINLE